MRVILIMKIFLGLSLIVISSLSFADKNIDHELRMMTEPSKARVFSLYLKELRKDPGLAGKLVLNIKIDEIGKLKECNVFQSELNSPDMENGVCEILKSIDYSELSELPYHGKKEYNLLEH